MYVILNFDGSKLNYTKTLGWSTETYDYLTFKTRKEAEIFLNKNDKDNKYTISNLADEENGE